MTLWRPFACFGQKSTCEVLRHVVQEGVPAKSMQYSYLVFSSKPGKAGSILPKKLKKTESLADWPQNTHRGPCGKIEKNWSLYLVSPPVCGATCNHASQRSDKQHLSQPAWLCGDPNGFHTSIRPNVTAFLYMFWFDTFISCFDNIYSTDVKSTTAQKTNSRWISGQENLCRRQLCTNSITASPFPPPPSASPLGTRGT